ncbi:MAG: nuclear transport factor 2 family protein [Acidobacteria bacterium]|nr:nuclear transport factor 2 family protein [Acidobacteriota bacterium]MBI3422109.1 nuclear transport factor 2 family protein [Acidobacteriota bacterium]
MKTRIYSITLFTCFVYTLSALAFGQTAHNNKAEQEVLKAVEAGRVALLKKDIAVLERYWTDEYILTLTGGNTSTKARWLAGFKANNAGYDEWEADEVKVVIYGTTAIYNARFKVKGHNNAGKSYTADWRCTGTLVKQHGVWRLAAAHFTDIKPPAAPPAQ